MKVWTKLDPEDLRAIVQDCGLAIHSDWARSGISKDGRAYRFRLALRPGSGQARGIPSLSADLRQLGRPEDRGSVLAWPS